jgi:hypothetical protein
LGRLSIGATRQVSADRLGVTAKLDFRRGDPYDGALRVGAGGTASGGRAMFSSSRHFWRRVQRRVFAGATLAAVLACAVGVPTRAPVVKSHAERYPCEAHPCGCQDAESCWRDCCCYTAGEKLAWAERVGVTPPEYVVAAAAVEPSQYHDDAACEVAAADCCGSAAPTCETEDSCCASTQVPASTAAPHESRGVTFVMIHAAMKCRGLSVTVAWLPPSLPVVAAEFFPPPIERFESPIAASILYEPPCPAVSTPPPDAALA